MEIRSFWLFLLFAFTLTNFWAQECESNQFKKFVTAVKGDLNRDGILDSVLVTQDTLSEYRPYRLEVFFIYSNETMELIESTDNAIIAQFPNGVDGYHNGYGFDNIQIKNGVIWIENQLLRGYYNHKFRYQSEGFELIGYTYVSSDGLGKTYHVDYNLSTGKLVEIIESYENDEVFKDTTSIVKLEVLPNLKEFVPLTGKHY